ncbi:tRNA (adenosine(37)-N6)-threonylcarbamoyltransferase complex transferase subunit TsaD [Neoehrlichia mikurensis]|uniref:tRNA N6-adenosine threonylcarbamoyltransferase n=1 Tax=Neoehrlichia mikurensis TaxID=89586 RepID=A0A9Q9BUW2_9RICK|nr:tRNA (adenosine(37)-N6)-threonylcarbamoyltransferase complex transferase subunit TsaD [Neoehrlichia mikurensis]QXK91934.1 tRNA (adenosine(37)-N6)-threonylcarbamoyltransferase complex transferase subunit TsaD [Neoehrlichia mikurensis]QXK93147.1 tRNA (adenosine(37)-N6)-threonylcarbamoyltransferase complex transferase subunit TsaD [Neoehrlichia mikurensis]QXK93627.1 tRNA (adenosine(37)-N6)-threonylcarbamoyltransferase complex transferase subunit TsaD [Neoehrlichia mikurensis]UTO55418.1 tRNA (ad
MHFLHKSEAIVLGIESSCDESAVAVVSSHGKVLSHKIISQKEHQDYGGVVPEIASRAHLKFLSNLIYQAVSNVVNFEDIDAIAVTSGPGLIGGLIVGVMMAKAIASVMQKPIIAINHLEAHALVIRMFHKISFPFLLLIISGGHCQFLIAYNVGKYKKLGSSIDDSLGEAFDKIAKMLNLGYPGGLLIEEKSINGNDRFFLPRALLHRAGCDFSFSGIKTAVKNIINKEKIIDNQMVCDISASFQKCVSDILVNRICNAIKMTRVIDSNIKQMVVTGGVAANNFLRNNILVCAKDYKFEVLFPPKNLCTDNAVMVGWAGVENLFNGNVSDLSFTPKSQWRLEDM